METLSLAAFQTTEQATRRSPSNNSSITAEWTSYISNILGSNDWPALDRLVARGVAHQSRARLGAAKRANAATAPRTRGRGSRDCVCFTVRDARRDVLDAHNSNGD